MNVLGVTRIIVNNLSFLILYPIKFFIQKSDIIILESSSHYRYAGNPKYLYEYLSINTNYNVYWLTESEDIKQYLDSKGFKYLSNRNIIHKIYITLKARVVVGSGTSFYDLFYLVSRDKNIVKICTMHGSGPKLSLARKYHIKDSLRVIKSINSFNYVSFCTEYAGVIVGVNQMFLSHERIKLLGAPKDDMLFNSTYVDDHYNNRFMLRSIIGKNINDKCRVIYYVPTYRTYPSEFPITNLLDFDEKRFYNFLEKHDIYFIFSDHPMSEFTNLLKQNDRFIYVAEEKEPLFDNLKLMMEVDMLMGDYSTLSTDFAILKKPQIFIMPDYEKNYKLRGYAEDIASILPGKQVETYEDLCKSITTYIGNRNKFLDDFGGKVDCLLEKYMSTSKTESSKSFTRFISEILE